MIRVFQAGETITFYFPMYDGESATQAFLRRHPGSNDDTATVTETPRIAVETLHPKAVVGPFDHSCAIGGFTGTFENTGSLGTGEYYILMAVTGEDSEGNATNSNRTARLYVTAAV